MTAQGEYEDYCQQRDQYYPHRRELTYDGYVSWAVRWDRECATAWACELPDWHTMRELETALCV
jgi:hypothetical protein